MRPWLGISMQRVTPDLAAGLNLPRPAGLVVKDVYADGPGEKAGFKRNDVIVAMRDQPIDDEASLRFRLATAGGRRHGAGQGACAPARRSMLEVPLTAPPEEPPRDRSVLQGRQPLSGATVVNMSPAVADELGLVEWRGGVAVVEVQPGSYAGALPAAGRHGPGDQRPGCRRTSPTSSSASPPACQSLSIGREGMVSTIQFR